MKINKLEVSARAQEGVVNIGPYLRARYGADAARRGMLSLVKSVAREWGWAVDGQADATAEQRRTGRVPGEGPTPEGTDRACTLWRATGLGSGRPYVCRLVDLRRAHSLEYSLR